MNERRRFAERLRAAGLDDRRFIDVLDGEKRSLDHTQREPDDPALTGHYGVYAGRGGDESGGYLADIDIDDYAENADSESLAAVKDLPDTFAVESPHTSADSPGHIYYKVTGDVGTAVVSAVEGIEDPTREEIEEGTKNPSPSWGEIRIENQYTVGPGSQLDGCDKEWCDECAKPDGGYYRIANDVPIAEISAEQLVEVLLADPAYPKDNSSDTEETRERRHTAQEQLGLDADELDEDVPESVEDRLEFALDHDDALDDLFHARGAEYDHNDRSASESRLAWLLAFWLGGDKSTVRWAMDKSRAEKWHARTDASYRGSILKAVDRQTEFFDPDSEESTDGDIGQQYAIETCPPPAYDPVDVEREAQWANLRGPRIDDWLGRSGRLLEIWGNLAGEGKTTCAGLGLADRDVPHVVTLPQHENCHEFVTDEAKPDGYYHHKGSGQPREDCCMAAAVDADENETPECDAHGHPSDWPRMCPIYERDTDDPVRVAFKAIERERSTQRAHELVDPHDGEKCAWQRSHDTLANADRVVTVHNYLSQKTVQNVGKMVVDDLQQLPVSERTLSVPGLLAAANRMDSIGRVDRTPGMLTGLARFVRDVVDVMTGGYDDPDVDSVADLTPPRDPERRGRGDSRVPGHELPTLESSGALACRADRPRETRVQ